METIKKAHYGLGIAYLEAEQYTEAIPEFETAIKLDPNFREAHCALCRTYLGQGELEKAGTALQAVLKLNVGRPAALELQVTLMKAYYEKGTAYLANERYTDAVTAFQKAITFDADLGDRSHDPQFESKHIYAHLGTAYIGLKAYSKAIDALQSALERDGDLVDVHYNLGYAHVEQQTYDAAILNLERVITADPQRKEAHYHLARAYRESGNLEAATNAVTEALRLDTNYQLAQDLADIIKQAHYNRGITYLNDERYGEAITNLQNAIILDSDFVSAHYNLGVAYLKMEMYARSVLSLQKTTRLNPKHKEAYHILALAHIGQQELSKAREAARAALKLDAEYQPARSLLEAIDPNFITPPTTKHLEIPETTTTQKTEQTTDVQADPKSRQQMHYELGTAYLDTAMYTEAIAEFEKAIDSDPDFAPAYVELGRVYLKIKKLDEAENAAKAALHLDSGSEAARQLLNDIKQEKATPVPTHPDEADDDSKDTPTGTPDTKHELERGLVLLNNKQYLLAAAAFKKVIAADPNSIQAHYGLGQAYFEISAFNDAKAAADEVLRLNINHQKARQLLQMIKFAEKMQRNRALRKKIFLYSASLGIIGAVIFAVVRFAVIPILAPAHLDLSIAGPLVLKGPSEDKVLHAGETGQVKITIRNTGSTARNVQLRIEASNDTGLRFKNPKPIPKLETNSEQTISISITANRDVKATSQDWQIRLFGKTGLLGKSELSATSVLSFKTIPLLPNPDRGEKR